MEKGSCFVAKERVVAEDSGTRERTHSNLISDQDDTVLFR
jgi:hypothetical protein